MITAVLRRTLVDLWDNAVVCFSLNIVLLGVIALLLYPMSLAAILPPIVFPPVVVAAVWATSVLLAATAGLVTQIAARADVHAVKCRPDLLFCFVLAFTVAGLAGLASLLLVDAGATHPMAVARSVGGAWLSLTALELLLLAPAFALDRDGSSLRRLTELVAIVMRFPLQCLVFVLAAAASLLATVGLLPGPAGAAYLFLRAGKMMRAGLVEDPFRGALGMAIDNERLTLKNRSPRSLLQPWRTS